MESIVMRLKAIVENRTKFVHFMIYQPDETVNSVYLYLSTIDGDEAYDNWYESIEDAKLDALKKYDVPLDRWQQIPDPLPGAVHDIEEPTVVVRHADGTVTLMPYDEALSKNLVQIPPTEVDLPDDPVLIARVKERIYAGDPLQAMKIYMTATRCDLLTAKIAIQLLSQQK